MKTKTSNLNNSACTPLSVFPAEKISRAKLFSTGPDHTPADGILECVESICQILDDDRTIDSTLMSEKLLPIIRQIDFYTELIKPRHERPGNQD